MKTCRPVIILFAFVLAASAVAAAQDPAPKMTAAELQRFLDEADTRIVEYRETFKNLTAEETRTTEVFDRWGNVEKRRSIVSDLIIYEVESGPRKGEISEYINVREVDGKPVKDRDKRALSLFKRLERANSVEKELEKIKEESLRYDEEISVYNVTLSPTVVLQQNARVSFEFAEAGRERLGDREAVVVRYHQIADTPAVDFKVKAPDLLRPSGPPRCRGTLWIDAETRRVLKSVEELVIEPERVTGPLKVLYHEAEYRPSEFGIAIPERIVYVSYSPAFSKTELLKLSKSGGKVEAKVRESKRFTIEYRNFKRFDVIVHTDRQD